MNQETMVYVQKICGLPGGVMVWHVSPMNGIINLQIPFWEVCMMKWEEVRKLYPDRFVKLQILKSHIENQVRYIDDMAVIQAFDNEKEATRELVRSKDDVLVYRFQNNITYFSLSVV